MKIDKAIKFMKILDEVSIEEVDKDRYVIRIKKYNTKFRQVICIIDCGQIEYCLEDLYNNGRDYEPIDFEQLNKLQQFTTMLQTMED